MDAGLLAFQRFKGQGVVKVYKGSVKICPLCFYLGSKIISLGSLLFSGLEFRV